MCTLKHIRWGKGVFARELRNSEYLANPLWGGVWGL
jgi:hypothetical protein